MDNKNNCPPLWNDDDMQEFENKIVVYKDLAHANMNLI